MALKMRKFTATVTFKGQVEAESRDEAVRIVQGVLDNATSVVVFENTDETEDQVSGKPVCATLLHVDGVFT